MKTTRKKLIALEEIQKIRIWTKYGETNLDKLGFSYVFLKDIESDITQIYDLGDIILSDLLDWYIEGEDGMNEIVEQIIELDY